MTGARLPEPKRDHGFDETGSSPQIRCTHGAKKTTQEELTVRGAAEGNAEAYGAIAWSTGAVHRRPRGRRGAGRAFGIAVAAGFMRDGSQLSPRITKIPSITSSHPSVADFGQ